MGKKPAISHKITAMIGAFVVALVVSVQLRFVPALATEIETPASLAAPNMLGAADTKAAGQEQLLASQADDEQVCMSVRVVGPNAEGNDTEWLSTTKVKLSSNQTGWDASKIAFDAAGLSYDASDAGWGMSLNTISSPYTKVALGWDANTGKYWQLFVDGEVASTGIDQIAPVEGRSIVWYYSSWGQSLNDAGEPSHTQYNEAVFESLDVVPTQLKAVWPEFNYAGSLTQAPTAQAVSQAWATQLGGGVPVSELLYVGDKIFAAVGQSFYPGKEHPYEMTLVCVDAATGAIESSTPLAGTIDFTSRPAFANGIVYVPLQGGAVQAINASTMLSRWVSQSVFPGSQSSCSLRVRDGVVYEGLAVYGSSGSFDDGALFALDEKTGTALWGAQLTGEGFYWSDVVVREDIALAGGTNGTLTSLDTKTGTQISSYSLGSPLNADIATWNDKFIVLTRDGVLHVVSLDAEGTITHVAELSVLGGAKAAPTIVGDVALCAGVGEDGVTPAVAQVDLAQLSVTKLITTADGKTLPNTAYGGVSAPVLVSQQGEKIYAYFTVNHAEATDLTWTSFKTGGNLYMFELGADEAKLLWAPPTEIAQPCDSPVIADEQGALYYLNDSGYVVKLLPAQAQVADSDPQPQPQPQPQPNPTSEEPKPAPTTQDLPKTQSSGNATSDTLSQAGTSLQTNQSTSLTPVTQNSTAPMLATTTQKATTSTGDRTSFELMSVLFVSGMALALYALLLRKVESN